MTSTSYDNHNAYVKLTIDNIEIKYRDNVLIDNFDADNISHLFERFYRGDKSHSERREGFGLGLAIAYEIVAVHNGNITANYSNAVLFLKLNYNKTSKNTEVINMKKIKNK